MEDLGCESTASRPYQCQKCGDSFTKSEHLVRHVRSHTREKPFKCANCGKRYGRHDILTRHRRDACGKHSGKTRNPVSRMTRSSQRVTSPVCSPPRAASADIPVTQLPTSLTDAGEQYDASRMQPAIFPGFEGSPSFADLPQTSTILPGSNDLTSGYVDFPTQGFDEQPSVPLDFFAFGENVADNDLFSFIMTQSLHDDLQNSQLLAKDASVIPLEAQDHAGTIQDSQDVHIPEQILASELLRIKQLWYTNIAGRSINDLYPEVIPGSGILDESGPSSPQRSGDQIDNDQRERFRKLLQVPVKELILPPLEQLNLCLRLYFTKVQPIFPIIHVGTFKPCRANGTLVVQMCGIGSIFTGFEPAFRQGLHLYDHLQKSVLLKWETSAAKDQGCLMISIQLALIGQLFGMLSGIPNLLITVDCFHGLILAWLRHFSSYKPVKPTIEDLNCTGEELDFLWRRWARSQEWIRISHCLHILDCELAHLIHREPLQSFTAYRHQFASSDAAFAARNANEWKEKYTKDLQLCPLSEARDDWAKLSARHPEMIHRLPNLSSITAYVALEKISSEARLRHATEHTKEETLDGIFASLMSFQQTFLTVGEKAARLDMQLHILWHVSFLTALANMDLLERAIGREGTALGPVDQFEVVHWANSQHGIQSIQHALVIGKITQSMTFSQTLAMHVPRALFWACVAILTFIRFKSPDKLATVCAEHNFKEIDSGQFEEMRILCAISGAKNPLRLAVSNMRDILQYHGHWRLCHRFATILHELSRQDAKSSA